MKRTIVMSMIMLMSIGSVCHSAELSVREKVLVRVILGQQIAMRLRPWQESEAGKKDSSSHPFAIALSNAKDKEQKLLKEFTALSKHDRLCHAQALAYLGNNAGIDVLKEAAFPTRPIGPYATNSGIEISESALCLLYLGFDFPDTFKFSETPNSLYSELDELLNK